MIKNRSLCLKEAGKIEQEIDSKHRGIYAWASESEKEREITRKLMREHMKKNKQ